MGRAKLKMELIEKEKSRNTTFKKRKEGLIRKLSEFTTLCDVKACMIIYGPNQTRPEIWPPQDPEEVRRFIDLYKSKSSGSVRKSGVVEFFNERKRQIEDELKKLKRKNQEAKYPTRPELLNVISEHQLRHLHAELTDKARCVRSRIELLKMKQRPQTEQNAMLMDHRRLHPSPVMVGIGSSNAANMQMKRQIYYESASGFYQSWPQYMVQPPLPLPPLPPQQPYLLQAMVQPQMQFLGNQEEMMMMRNQAVRAHNLNQDGVKYEDFTNNRMFSC
ncbi:agamous-like MADS-box protein AGL14 [Salvia splendens]|nr:agamous-like MADS-box protein AGL14 [Salvia splendens]